MISLHAFWAGLSLDIVGRRRGVEGRGRRMRMGTKEEGEREKGEGGRKEEEEGNEEWN